MGRGSVLLPLSSRQPEPHAPYRTARAAACRAGCPQPRLEESPCHRQSRFRSSRPRGTRRPDPAAGRVLKEAFGNLGSAGGHASMAKAIIPLAELARAFDIDARNIRSINRKAEHLFLRALHTTR